MAVAYFWKEIKTNNKCVTISDGSDEIFFKSYGACMLYLEKMTDYKKNTIQGFLAKKVPVIGNYKIFYD